MSVSAPRSRQADRRGSSRAADARTRRRPFSMAQVAWPLYVTYPLAWCVISYAIAGRFAVTGEFLAYAAIVPACQTVMIWIALRLGRRFFQP